MKGSKRPPEAEQRVQRVPFIAAPRAGLTSKPVGNMSSDVGLQTLPQTWAGYPNYFDETTAVDHDVLQLLNPFGDSGAVLDNLCDFSWTVAQGPLFQSSNAAGPQWTCMLMWPEEQARLVHGIDFHKFTLYTVSDWVRRPNALIKKQVY